MLKVLLYSFSMCRHKLYQILSISKNVPRFVLLITGYFKVLYYTGQNCSGFKVFNSKVHHFKFIRAHNAKPVLAIIAVALLSLKFYHFSLLLFVSLISASYSKISGMLLSLEL